MPFAFMRGNLIFNGGFEQGLSGWVVDNVGLQTSPKSHEGLLVAAMGKGDNTQEAEMYQDVPVVPRQSYKLQLFVSGLEPAPADLIIDVRWIGQDDCDLGTALCPPGPIVIPAASIGQAQNGAYKAVIAYTQVTPHGASSARVFLHKLPGSYPSNSVLVDDVIFAARG